MTLPLPPELALLREDLAAAARRRARRRRWPRVLGLSTLITVSIGTAAVATGIAPSPFAGDPTTVTVVRPDGTREEIRCTRTSRGELCRTRVGDGVGAAQLARALAAGGAQLGVIESTGGGSVATYHRTGIRVGARPAGTGGYRSTGPLTVTMTVAGEPAIVCTGESSEPACRRYRAIVARAPVPDYQRLARELGATRLTIETTSRCRLAARYECAGAPRAQAIHLSRDPASIPQPGVTYGYAKVTVTRR